MDSEDTQDLESARKGKDEVAGLKSALQAERRERQSLETTVAELRGRVEGLGARPAPKEMTRADLRRAVEEEKITQDEADALWERQVEERVTRKAVEAATGKIESGSLQARISGEIGRYKKAVEGLDDKESAAFKKVAGEFRHLVDLGYAQDDMRTEVAALRAAFGDVGLLESTARPRDREGHQETGGRGGERGESSTAWPKGMSAATRSYYEDQIAKGLIADKAAAVAEFNYKPKHAPKLRRVS